MSSYIETQVSSYLYKTSKVYQSDIAGFGEYVKPKKGAELHKVVNGKDTVVAIFDGKHFVEVKGK